MMSLRRRRGEEGERSVGDRDHLRHGAKGRAGGADTWGTSVTQCAKNLDSSHLWVARTT